VKILITGVSGFIGQNLAPLLKEQDHSVIGMDILNKIQNDLLSVLDEYRQHDLLIQKGIENKIADVECIIHLAGEASVTANKNQIKLKNEVATSNLLEALKNTKIRKILFLSSEKVNLRNHSYAESKYNAEQKIINCSADSDLSYTILRCAAIYGQGMKSNLVRWLEKVKIDSIYSIPPSNSEVSLIGISDLCNIISRCIDNGSTDNKVYLVTDGQTYKINEIEKATRDIFSDSNKTKYYPKWFVYIGAKVGDILNLLGLKFPLNSSAYHMFFHNKVEHDTSIYNDIGIQPTQNFLEELPVLLSE